MFPTFPTFRVPLCISVMGARLLRGVGAHASVVRFCQPLVYSRCWSWLPIAEAPGCLGHPTSTKRCSCLLFVSISLLKKQYFFLFFLVFLITFNLASDTYLAVILVYLIFPRYKMSHKNRFRFLSLSNWCFVRICPTREVWHGG